MSNDQANGCDAAEAGGERDETHASGQNASFRTGFVAIVGRPNVGKSTLLNRMIGQKISIVSRKAQTTRHRVTGILTDERSQFVFVDTPGFQTQHRNALNRTMNRTVTQALASVDLVFFVVEAGRFGEDDRKVVSVLPENARVVLVINKLDRLSDQAQVLPFIQRIAAVYPFAEVVPLSAERGTNVDALIDAARPYLPIAEAMFDADDITDRSERFLASEFLREKLFRLLGDELPYGIAVEIEKFETEGQLRRIFAAVIVDKPGHKGIVIGKGGEQLKRISSEARVELEKLFGGKVYLEVWVKVKSGWADDERALKSLGYD
ncbi:MAG: GTPase Era [Rhodocyclaceae bacterium]